MSIRSSTSKQPPPNATFRVRGTGVYLAKRSQLVIDLATQVRDRASQGSEQPAWAPPGSHPIASLITEVEVWRAAVGVDPKTAEQPEQDNCRLRPPFGNRTSINTFPCAAATFAQMWGKPRLVDPLQITSAKIDIASLQHALVVGVLRPDPACELQCQLKRFGRSKLAGPEQLRA